MKHFAILSGGSLLVLTLSGCQPSAPTAEQRSDAVSSSSVMTSPAVSPRLSAEGVVQKSGVGIYMEGTHQLVTDDGQILLLISATVNLDDYLDMRVSVVGEARPTIENGGTILHVESIQRVSAESTTPQVLEEEPVESAPSTESTSSSEPPLVAAPPPVVASSSARPPVPRSSAAAVRSSASSVPLTVETSSSSASGLDMSASITRMKKVVADSVNFSQKYCTGHIGFCIPLHRNWYFQSFGATMSPYLWHVEIADHAVEEAGQGVIIVNLVIGATSADSEGAAQQQGDFVVAMRQWTGNRHFEISGSKELSASVEFIAQGLETYQSPEAQ